ncbi:MAG: ATP-dependent zinc metalloprotease FtsH [Clostridia bacterium]|nr:ATP-dependent zinc metalloprotease FtsH [Clostridia bacterium]
MVPLKKVKNRRTNLKKFKNLSFYIILFIIFLIIYSVLSNQDTTKELSYSQFIEQLQSGNVKEVSIDVKVANIKLANPILDGTTDFVVVYGDEALLEEQLIQAQVSDPALLINFVEDKGTPWWASLLPFLVMIILFGVFFFFIIQQSQGSNNKAMSFGKSKAKLVNEDDKKKNFTDVAGAEEEKAELQELVDFLKSPDKFLKLGARIPKGVLLIGPPGTGKTLLAKAVAGEAGVPFFSISGSDFVEMFVGVGASRVRDLFEQAKKNAPCIIFIDEIDAVGRHRGAGMGGGHDEREQTLNQLLVEMDGFGVNEGIIILAATNRPDILDPALLRPGRFDRRVTVNYPDTRGREEILKIHSRNKPLDDDVNLENISKLIPMFTGADIENLMNEAAILAARRNLEKITMVEVKEAIFKVGIGPEKKSRRISDYERKLTAYHEAGHAIATRVISSTSKVDRVSIIPIGQAGGYTSFRPHEDKSFYTKNQLEERIIIALGGRAAEEVALGEISTGASNDLQQANQVARSMIIKYGMSDTMKNIVFDQPDEVFIGKDYGHVKNYSENLASKIDDEVKIILDKAYEKVKNIIKEKYEILQKIANTLLEKEKIEEEEFEEIFMSI